MNTELKKIEDFLKLMNNAVFVKTIENVERIRNIKNELFHVKAKLLYNNLFSKYF